MYAHEESHVESYLSAVESSFDEMAEAQAQGSIEARLKGAPARIGFKRLT